MTRTSINEKYGINKKTTFSLLSKNNSKYKNSKIIQFSKVELGCFWNVVIIKQCSKVI